MARGKRTSPSSQRRAVVAALQCTHRSNGRPNYKRVARKYKLQERTVHQYAFEAERNIPQRERGRPPMPHNTAFGVAKKLLCLPSYKREWPLRRLADEIHVTKSTLQKVLPRAKLYIENQRLIRVQVVAATERCKDHLEVIPIEIGCRAPC